MTEVSVTFVKDKCMEAETEEEQNEIDLLDDENFKEQAIEALISIGLTEDEAERQIEDMF